jgi:hypothetical protein
LSLPTTYKTAAVFLGQGRGIVNLRTLEKDLKKMIVDHPRNIRHAASGRHLHGHDMELLAETNSYAPRHSQITCVPKITSISLEKVQMG